MEHHLVIIVQRIRDWASNAGNVFSNYTINTESLENMKINIHLCGQMLMKNDAQDKDTE